MYTGKPRYRSFSKKLRSAGLRRISAGGGEGRRSSGSEKGFWLFISLSLDKGSGPARSEKLGPPKSATRAAGVQLP